MANTSTWTKQEKLFRDLNKTVVSIIEHTLEDGSLTDYRAFDSNGEVSNQKPSNLYSSGVLATSDFIIMKEDGGSDRLGKDIKFYYQDKDGTIFSNGEEFDKSFVVLDDEKRVSTYQLLNFLEEEEYLEKVLENLKKVDEYRQSSKDGSQQLKP